MGRKNTYLWVIIQVILLLLLQISRYLPNMSKMSVVVAVNIKCQAATIKQYFVRKNIQISRRIGKNKPVASSNSNNARMSMKTKRGTGLPIVSKKIEKAAGWRPCLKWKRRTRRQSAPATESRWFDQE